MKIAVTGANGLVGSRLCQLLASRGHDVLGLSRGPLRGEARGWRYVSADLTEAAELTGALETFKPEVVVNPASMTDVDGCEKDPHGAFAVNVGAVARLSEITKTLGAHL